MKNQNFDDNSLNVNRNNKDSMFSSLFSNPDILREHYSAIEGIPIPPDIPIEINTLSGVLFKGKINVLSFIIDNRLVVLIEHQSTINNNVPLRLLIYIARIYEKRVNMNKVYQTKLEKIPCPEFIVLYNGKNRYAEYKELRLSDAFKDIEGLKITDTIPLELTAKVYNINQGHNFEILKKCKTLENYSFFIEKVREYLKRKLSLEKAVKNTIKYCKKKNILKKYLQEHSSEVFNMLFTEWNWDDALEFAREEGREDGLEEGMEKGLEKGLEKGIEKGLVKGREEGLELTARNALAKGISVRTVQEITGLSIEKIKELK